ncbi:carboxypeptidase-like regulatory domain-containing protein [Chitinophaga sp. 22536]|uniref:carboxypeptidase-like regulatory domain-containing protein n=1 Tax=unclassified Chitinophaga TaxID=2619133 RepID=UPI003F870178
MAKNILWLLTCFILLFSACNKKNTPDSPTQPGTPPADTLPISGKKIQAGLQGLVMDEQNAPLVGAQVQCGDQNTTTDQYGTFRFPQVTLTEEAAVVNIQKAGYFSGVRTFRVTGTGREQFIQIQLIPKTTAGTFDAAVGGTIAASNAQFTFTSNQVLDASNNIYKGKASLAYAFINPESHNFADMMPGDLRAVNDKNELVGLQSLGMMALELQGENGEKLHLDGRNNVNFRMTIPAMLQKGAPATIPLWYFDGSSGLWRQEGNAQKTGDSYTGTVKHFSFWNCDAQFPIINLRAIFKDKQNNLLANTRVQISRADSSNYVSYTDGAGEVNIFLPANEQVTITVKDADNNILFSQKIGPWSTDVSPQTFTISTDFKPQISLSGLVSTCDGGLVTKGVVNIQVNGIHYSVPIVNGQYTAPFLRCNSNTANLVLNATDEIANKMSTSTYQLPRGNYFLHQAACDTAMNTLYYWLEGGGTRISSPQKSVTLSYNSADTAKYYTLSAISSTSPKVLFNMRLPNIKPGTFTSPYVWVNTIVKTYTNDTITVIITHTGGASDYLEGVFFGTVLPSQGNPTPISGSFKVRIE